ncbi:MAG: hypothetical protein WCP19_07815 [Chloroflexota bacterium]
MTTELKCSFCGAPLESENLPSCPSCGSTLSNFSNQATMISSKSSFGTSAEVMDEVKRLAKEGKVNEAAQVAGEQFGLSREEAANSVDQTIVDMGLSGAGSSSHSSAEKSSKSQPEIIDAPGYKAPIPPSSKKNWVIGGVIAAVIFLCLCCCLPIIVSAFMYFKK